MSSRARLDVPDLGVGVGLRVPHYRHVLSERPEVDFFEIISENFLVEGGKPRYHLARVLESYSVAAHGVSLGIAGPEPLDRDYLRRLKRLLSEVKPPWVSDHFCWSGAGGAHLHDLLPIPYTKLEFAYLEIFDAEDAQPVTPEALASIAESDWERARIEFHPAVRLLKTAYPVAALRRQLIEAQKHAQTPPVPAPEAQCLLLFRRELALFHEQLSEGAYALLNALTHRVPLVAACIEAQREVPTQAASIRENVGAWFQAWAARGLICQVLV